MPIKVLFTRPNHDPVTAYLHYWSAEIIKFATDKGCNVIELDGSKATAENFQSYLTRVKPELVLLNGHGSEEQVSGQHNEKLVTLESADLLKNKIVYALACRAAKTLGPKSIEMGARAFIGYEEDFTFVCIKSREGNPAKDKRAEPFKIASNAVSMALVKGNTADDAYQKSQQVFRGEIRRLANSEARTENKDVRFWLFWDMLCQKVCGNGTASVEN